MDAKFTVQMLATLELSALEQHPIQKVVSKTPPI